MSCNLVNAQSCCLCWCSVALPLSSFLYFQVHPCCDMVERAFVLRPFFGASFVDVRSVVVSFAFDGGGVSSALFMFVRYRPYTCVAIVF